MSSGLVDPDWGQWVFNNTQKVRRLQRTVVLDSTLVVGFSLDTGIFTWLGNGTEKAKVQHRKVGAA